MSDSAEARRMKVEDALASLGSMRVEIRLASLRVNQAIERWPVTRHLLRPVALYLVRWERATGLALEALRMQWLAGNRNNWNEEEWGNVPELLSDEWKES